MGLPGGTSDKNPTCPCRRYKRPGFNPWVRKIPWRSTWQLTPVFLPGNPMDRGAWKATVHGVAKSRTRLSDFTSLHFPLTHWGMGVTGNLTTIVPLGPP